MIERPTFSLDRARQCVALSHRAYSEATIESDSAHVLIVPDPGSDALLIAFRGTASLHDVVTDARICLGEMPASFDPKVNEMVGKHAKIHRGFLQAFTSVIDPLVAKLRELHADRPENVLTAPLIITGHSLGGALAMLCAKSLAGLLLNVRAVYTFGQPRVGNRAFCKSYDQAPAGSEGGRLKEKTWRFVNEEDPVPRVPGVLAGYRHAGQEVFLPSFGGAPITNPKLCRKAVSDAWGIYKEWDKGGPLECLGDHRCTDYMRRLGVPDPPSLGSFGAASVANGEAVPPEVAAQKLL